MGIEKIVEIDTHIACAFSGLTADSKTLIDRARVESQNHWFTYDEKMQVESVAQAVSNLAIAFGNSDDDIGVMSRPFGVAILFAGYETAFKGWMRTVPSCSTWTPAAPISSSTPRPSAAAARAP